ncbi:hypothetical protein [Nostocoides veronense]|uniref:Uncharacterized protein n=1 Tax=Nostocoides veronense TaxID=330836 RepID=A0ABN2LY51_9MICO
MTARAEYTKAIFSAAAHLSAVVRNPDHTREEIILTTQNLNAARLARFLHDMEISNPDCLSAEQRAEFSLQLVAPNA